MDFMEFGPPEASQRKVQVQVQETGCWILAELDAELNWMLDYIFFSFFQLSIMDLGSIVYGGGNPASRMEILLRSFCSANHFRRMLRLEDFVD